MTGDDDPDDRRTYPVAGHRAASPTAALLANYRQPRSAPQDDRALRDRRLPRPAGRRAAGRSPTAARPATMRPSSSSTAARRRRRWRSPSPATCRTASRSRLRPTRSGTGERRHGRIGGELAVTLGPLSAVLLLDGHVDLTPPAAPAGLTAAEGNGSGRAGLDAVPARPATTSTAARVSGGGYVKINTSPVDRHVVSATRARNGATYYYVVTGARRGRATRARARTR